MTAGTVARNVFHDLTPGGGVVVSGAAAVLRNTFLRVAGDGAAADQGAFEDNIVAFMSSGALSPSVTGYNLFDAVDAPYADAGLAPTDVAGASLLDPSTFVPSVSSAALDAAESNSARAAGRRRPRRHRRTRARRDAAA